MKLYDLLITDNIKWKFFPKFYSLFIPHRHFSLAIAIYSNGNKNATTEPNGERISDELNNMQVYN